jgi:hypothetical protein
MCLWCYDQMYQCKLYSCLSKLNVVIVDSRFRTLLTCCRAEHSQKQDKTPRPFTEMNKTTLLRIEDKTPHPFTCWQKQTDAGRRRGEIGFGTRKKGRGRRETTRGRKIWARLAGDRCGADEMKLRALNGVSSAFHRLGTRAAQVSSGWNSILLSPH